MSGGIASIALLTPVVASNAVFSARRASRGVEAVEENPLYAIMNFDIAAAQVLKGIRAMDALASPSATASVSVFDAAKVAKTTKDISTAGKVFHGIGKVVDYTARNINPIICVSSMFKVGKSDEKVKELGKESWRLGFMFTFEELMKVFLGMPMTKNSKLVKREGFYNKIFKKEQIETIKKYCSTKKVLKYVPGAVKGLLFVGASISGYKLGDMVANSILGESKKASMQVA